MNMSFKFLTKEFIIGPGPPQASPPAIAAKPPDSGDFALPWVSGVW
jgi:hypothetical protein